MSGVVAKSDDANTGAVTADVIDVDDVTHKFQHFAFEDIFANAAG